MVFDGKQKKVLRISGIGIENLLCLHEDFPYGIISKSGYTVWISAEIFDQFQRFYTKHFALFLQTKQHTNWILGQFCDSFNVKKCAYFSNLNFLCCEIVQKIVRIF